MGTETSSLTPGPSMADVQAAGPLSIAESAVEAASPGVAGGAALEIGQTDASRQVWYVLIRDAVGQGHSSTWPDDGDLVQR